jgi:hypothetical protein
MPTEKIVRELLYANKQARTAVKPTALLIQSPYGLILQRKKLSACVAFMQN